VNDVVGLLDGDFHAQRKPGQEAAAGAPAGRRKTGEELADR
jgi:hypothetical protein